jgi:tRNA pseudouridine38-40 synthase
MNKVSTLLNSEISIMGAGRTDTGVHARKCMPILILKLLFIPSFHKLNLLTKDIVIYDIIAVKEAAHARFDALKNL